MKTTDKHLIEYEVRWLDEYGDAQIVDHYPTKKEALSVARGRFPQGIKAVAVEKHVSKRPAYMYGMPDVFTTIAVFGDKSALELWGWQPGESTWLEQDNFNN